VQLIRDKLALVCPAVLDACAGPFESLTWLAALEVVAEHGDEAGCQLAERGYEAFAGLVRAALGGWGGQASAGRPL
jgi:hypothetical protein